MIVDDIGEVTITNDGTSSSHTGATILKKLEVEHPTANLLVQLAQLQDAEVGDGTTSVVILAAELLKRANELIKMKVHPTNIITGYKIAAKEACSYIENKLAVSVDKLGEEALLNCAKTSMSSKLINADPDFFGKLVVDSIKYVKQEGFLGSKPKYNIKSINILKAHGQSST
jgi:T-complex protein 1 subunit alpha